MTSLICQQHCLIWHFDAFAFWRCASLKAVVWKGHCGSDIPTKVLRLFFSFFFMTMIESHRWICQAQCFMNPCNLFLMSINSLGFRVAEAPRPGDCTMTLQTLRASDVVQLPSNYRKHVTGSIKEKPFRGWAWSPSQLSEEMEHDSCFFFFFLSLFGIVKYYVPWLLLCLLLDAAYSVSHRIMRTAQRFGCRPGDVGRTSAWRCMRLANCF